MLKSENDLTVEESPSTEVKAVVPVVAVLVLGTQIIPEKQSNDLVINQSIVQSNNL